MCSKLVVYIGYSISITLIEQITQYWVEQIIANI